MELKQLYQVIILDHAKNPRNKGKCEGYNHDAKAHNPLCGDKVHIYLKLDKDKNISGLSFEGEGCAISLASASILTDTLKGRDLQFSKKVTDDFLNMLKNKSKISCVIVEPIQGEAGVKFSDKGFLNKIQELCRKNNILFIVDEVQVGIGRTGKTFCHEHYNLSPDIITLAKALGGGLPCGAIMVHPRLSESLSPGSHGTTMGGNLSLIHI